VVEGAPYKVSKSNELTRLFIICGVAVRSNQKIGVYD